MRHLCWLAALLIAACSSGDSPARAVLVEAQEANDLIEARDGDLDFVILDVRTRGEFDSGHLEGAVLIDYLEPDFEDRVGELDRGRTYLVYCGSGFRSAGACERMLGLGFRDLYDLAGGFNEWVAEGYPWVVD